MKKSVICGLSVFQILFCSHLAAQEAEAPDKTPETAAIQAEQVDANHAVVQINQPYVSKVFGELTLPFMWEVNVDEKAKRLVATETRTERPARLTIDIITVPKDVSGEQVGRNMISAVAEALGTTAEIKVDKEKIECGKSKCPKLTFIRSTFEGTESGTPRRCALEIVPSSGQVAVLSICTHAERTYEPELNAIVHQIFTMMK